MTCGVLKCLVCVLHVCHSLNLSYELYKKNLLRKSDPHCSSRLNLENSPVHMHAQARAKKRSHSSIFAIHLSTLEENGAHEEKQQKFYI